MMDELHKLSARVTQLENALDAWTRHDLATAAHLDRLRACFVPADWRQIVARCRAGKVSHITFTVSVNAFENACQEQLAE